MAAILSLRTARNFKPSTLRTYQRRLPVFNDMTTTETEIFATLAASQDPAAMLDHMVDHFRAARQPMELFEALKMRARHQLNLPLVTSESEPKRTEEVERQLETGLLDACREAGVMLMEEGRIGEGWMYLRPLGDIDFVREVISKIEINDDNYDEMIQVLLHEGIDVGRGYQAVLDHQGTCNSITLFEQSLVQRSKTDRQAAGSRLLDHLYDELTTLVRADIAKRDKPAEDDETLDHMIESRRWVLDDGGYHLDTTHLSSTVRIASSLTDPVKLRKAWELTQYGRRLHHQFQYPGEEPFVDFYPAYAAFYSTLLGEDVDAGLKYFERKAKSVDTTQHGSGAIETYVDLLDRVGRHGEAIKVCIDLVPSDVPPQTILSQLLEIAAKGKAAGDTNIYDPILNYCQDHNDVLGYAAVLHAKS